MATLSTTIVTLPRDKSFTFESLCSATMPGMSRCVEKAKRWRIRRPRFTVRTLAIFVTLVCAYFGAWEATKTHADAQSGCGYVLGKDDIEIQEAIASMPFLVRQDEYWRSLTGFDGKFDYARRYYFWLLGPKFALPFESKWDGL